MDRKMTISCLHTDERSGLVNLVYSVDLPFALRDVKLNSRYNEENRTKQCNNGYSGRYISIIIAQGYNEVQYHDAEIKTSMQKNRRKQNVSETDASIVFQLLFTYTDTLNRCSNIERE